MSTKEVRLETEYGLGLILLSSVQFILVAMC